MCDPNTGTCVQVARSCNDNNPFTVDYCDGLLLTCEYKNLNCDDGNPCTTDGYDVKTGNCSHKNVTCDDGNQCTNDYCDTTIGCVHTPVILPQNDMCSFYVCDPKAGVITLSTACPVACSSCDPLGGCTNCTTTPFSYAEGYYGTYPGSTVPADKQIEIIWVLAAGFGGAGVFAIIVTIIAFYFCKKPGDQTEVTEATS